MSWLGKIVFLFLSLSSICLYAQSNDQINKSDFENQQDREIGTSITPIFAMDTINPQIAVVSPNGGENWLMDTQKSIIWYAIESNFNDSPIHIMLSIDNGENYESLVDSVGNSGSYLWTIPDLVGPLSLIKIWATDNFGNTGYDVSDVVFTLPGTTVSVTPLFTMDTVAPIVNLISPNGGEIWNMGETHTISWTAEDSNLSSLPITLECMFGISWSTLEASFGNTGSYDWLIPDSLAPQAYVRVKATDIFGNTTSDISQEYFSISSSVPAMVQNVRLAIVDNFNIEITWDPVTQSIQGHPIVPTGYIILANSTDDPFNPNSFYILATTDGANEFVHVNALSNAPRTFYRIVAVVSNKGNLSDIQSIENPGVVRKIRGR